MVRLTALDRNGTEAFRWKSKWPWPCGIEPGPWFDGTTTGATFPPRSFASAYRRIQGVATSRTPLIPEPAFPTLAPKTCASPAGLAQLEQLLDRLVDALGEEVSSGVRRFMCPPPFSHSSDRVRGGA
jgi:hypothetical protein